MGQWEKNRSLLPCQVPVRLPYLSALTFFYFDLQSPTTGALSIDPDNDARLPQSRGQHM